MQCIGKKPDNQPCQNHRMAGSAYCFFHDPASSEQRRAAQSKGGSNRARLEAVPAAPSDFNLRDPEKTMDLLNHVVNRLDSRPMDATTACAIGYIVNLARPVNEARERAAQAAPAKLWRERMLELEAGGMKMLDSPEMVAMKLLRQLTKPELVDLCNRSLDPKNRVSIEEFTRNSSGNIDGIN